MSIPMSNVDKSFNMPKRPLTWFITGCSSGLGTEIARRALEQGHNVIATSRNPSKTPDLVQEIESKGGKWLQLDVNDLNSGKVIENLESSGTRIDILVNNAGYSIHHVVEQFTEKEVRDQMDTLYFGPFRLIRATLPFMRHRRFGVILNVSSGAGLEGRESMGAYAGAKAALDGVTKVLAKEVADFNVRVVYVSLGTFNTRMATQIQKGKVPLAADYRGSVADQTIEILTTGNYQPDGDRIKASKAIYEVITGEGAGAGHEAETHLPLGRDVTTRVKLVRDRLDHALEVFSEITNNVYVER